MIPLSRTPSSVRFTFGLVTLTSVGAHWADFRAPGDASADGGAPVAVGGTTRLGLEPVLLLGALAAVIDLAGAWTGVLFAGAVAWHLVATRDRVRWLLGRRDRGVASVRHRHTPIEEVAP